jgi:hypothetical protein
MSALSAAGANAHAPRLARSGTHDRVVPARARQLSALFERDVELVERLNDAQHRLKEANERLWSGLAPDAFGLIYDDAAAAASGTSPIVALIRDGGPTANSHVLAALQHVRWTIHRAFRAYEMRARSGASSRSRWASSPSSSQTRSARPAGARRRRSRPTSTSLPEWLPERTTEPQAATVPGVIEGTLRAYSSPTTPSRPSPSPGRHHRRHSRAPTTGSILDRRCPGEA